MISFLVSASCSYALASANHNNSSALYNGKLLHRQSVSPPAIPCNSSNEGESLYKAVHADMIWICKSKEWIPYK